MKPFNLTLTNELRLTIQPESDAHANGHPVLTYTYSIFYWKLLGIEDTDLTQQNKANNPDYCGTVSYKQPGNLFTYTEDGKRHLSAMELEEVIEKISLYRNTPRMWKL